MKRGILLQGTTEKVINQKRSLLGPLMRVELPSMKNALTSVAKSVSIPQNALTPVAKGVSIPLGLTAAASATDIFGSVMNTLMISKEEMKDILEIVKYLEKSGLSNKGGSKII